MENDAFVTIAFILPHKPQQTACVGFILFIGYDCGLSFRATQGETEYYFLKLFIKFPLLIIYQWILAFIT